MDRVKSGVRKLVGSCYVRGHVRYRSCILHANSYFAYSLGSALNIISPAMAALIKRVLRIRRRSTPFISYRLPYQVTLRAHLCILPGPFVYTPCPCFPVINEAANPEWGNLQ